ncbi:MAG TPA: cytochrome c oxidase subunit II [Acidimicrobiales bacterium]|nr:cytochrome c oxidase subunit II [Acidimicrobiales bacterium]
MEPPALSPQGVSDRTRRWRRLRRIVALPIAALALAGCTVPNFGASPGATTSSQSVFHLWQGFTIGAIIVGGFTLILIFWAVIFYRRKSENIPKQSQYHIPLEMTYTIIPVLIVLGLFAATLVVENKEVALPKSDVTINVNAFQWGWKFSYPGQNVVVVGQTTQDPEMVMPVNENVHINLTSSDVVHGFYVHAFNFSRYALPGILNQFTLRAVNTGTYNGQCTQLCGLYHSLMFFRVKVVSQSQYSAWLSSEANVLAAKAAQIATNQQTSSITPTKPNKSKGGY